MKSVMLSLKPKYCELIINGKKTIEVRKTRPKLKTPFKCYIYCTQGEPEIYKNGNQYVTDDFHILSPKARDGFERTSGFTEMNGKVIGEFICDFIKPIQAENFIVKEDREKAIAGTCMTRQELIDYMGWKGKNLWDCKVAYGWHISKLKIYDESKELSEFSKHYKAYDFSYAYMTDLIYQLTRPPQSWYYVEENEKC